MPCVTIMYPNQENAIFDFDYYLDRHMPQTARLLGNNIEIRKGWSSPTGGPAPFVCICTIRIKSLEEFVTIMTNEGAALIADVPNYTNIEPVIQIDEVVLDMAMSSAA
jgi:uncharacterized protein (TIGR02118 family)